uniref:Uncharacterized protein n=1 Tax=Arundo donax TaxID=35708 RepID=A0A0A8YBL7_ARUDO
MFTTMKAITAPTSEKTKMEVRTLPAA